MSEKLNKYLEYVFASTANFEKTIFEIESEQEREEILDLIAYQIVHESEIKNKVNFTLLSSYNNLDVSQMAYAVVKLLFNEAVEWFTTNFDLVSEEEILHIIESDKLKVYTIHQLGMNYFFDYQHIFMNSIAQSYFELLRQSQNFRVIGKVAQDAITGTSKNRSLFLTKDNGQLIRRADQVWMRVDQASKAKKQRIFTVTNELKRHKEQLEDIQLRVWAIDTATRLTSDVLKRYTAEYIRNVFTEDDPKYLKDRKLLTMLPAGDLAFQMETLCEKASINSKTKLGKDEFKKIQEIFAKAKINNTPQELKKKRMELEQRLPVKKEHYVESVKKYQKIKDEPLEDFDDQLTKIKAVMIENLKKRHVQK